MTSTKLITVFGPSAGTGASMSLLPWMVPRPAPEENGSTAAVVAPTAASLAAHPFAAGSEASLPNEELGGAEISNEGLKGAAMLLDAGT